jgi:hypothetical protein
VAGTFAQSCPTITGLQYIVALLLSVIFLTPLSTSAGAWTPEKGRVNVIVSTSVSQTPVADRAITTDLYYERGLGHDWALVLAPSLSNNDNLVARNEAQISLRRALYQDYGWAVSTQIGAYVWREAETSAISSGAEVRFAVGKSFGNGGWANVETAVRGCGGVNGLRWEGTLGHRVRRNDRAIVKVFGDSEGCAANITRVQASYVYALTPKFGLELGWRETLPNVGNWNERGAVIGLWLAF